MLKTTPHKLAKSDTPEKQSQVNKAAQLRNHSQGSLIHNMKIPKARTFGQQQNTNNPTKAKPTISTQFKIKSFRDREPVIPC